MTEAGDYKFCFDNSFSHITTKTIFFAYIISNPNSINETDSEEDFIRNQQWLLPEEVYDMKVEDIKVCMFLLSED